MPKHRPALLIAFLLFIALPILSADSDLKFIDVDGGGTIVYGPLPGQSTLHSAMTQMIHNVAQRYSDDPQIPNFVQSKTGDVMAAFFTVTAKNDNNKQVAGLIIVQMQEPCKVRAAVLSDDAGRFRKTLNPMFQRLLTEAHASQPQGGQAGANPAAQAPAAPLQPFQFPDGSAVIGLPAGWNVDHAQSGDILAHGPRGEYIRFGLSISVLDPNNPQTRTVLDPNYRGGPAPGNFVLIPYGTDPAATLKSAMSQLFQKQGRQAPNLNVTGVKEIPSESGHSYFISGDLDRIEGQGTMATLTQVSISQPLALGGYQLTVYQVAAPKQLAAEETPTAAAIFRSYQLNNGVMMNQVNSAMRQSDEITNAALDRGRRMQDASDKSFAGFMDAFHDESVVVDTETGARGRMSDDLAGILVNSNTNRFEYVPPSQYIKGRDY